MKVGTKISRGVALGLAVALFLLAFPACGSLEPTRSGPLAPDFSVTTLEGGIFTLSANRGKVIVLDFLIANCPTCAEEIPALAQAYAQFKDSGLEVLVLDVSPYDTPKDLEWAKATFGGGDHHWALDRGQSVAIAYGVRTLGTTIVVDREGRIIYRDEGTTRYRQFKDILGRAL